MTTSHAERLLEQGRRAIQSRKLALATKALDEAASAWIAASGATGDTAARRAAEALADGAYARVLAGNIDAAEPLALRATELDPSSALTWMSLGNVRAERRAYAAALEAFARGAELAPGLASIPYNRADTLRRLGRVDDAIADLSRAIELARDEDTRVDALFNRARAYQAAGRFDEALADMRKVARGGSREGRAAVGALEQLKKLQGRTPARLKPAPFRRYGLRPASWTTTTDLRCRVRFVRAPSPKLRERLAQETTPFDTFVESVDYAWADAFLVIRFTPTLDEGPAYDDDDDLDELHASEMAEAFEALEALILAMHRIAPIAEVVGLYAAGINVDDRQEVWSILQQPVPDVGPDMPRGTGFFVPAFGDLRTFAPLEADAVFERARLAAHGEAASAVSVTLARAANEELPPRRPLEASDLLSGPEDRVALAPCGAALVRRGTSGLERRLPDGTIHAVAVAPGEDGEPRAIEAVAVAPDGRHALFSVSNGERGTLAYYQPVSELRWVDMHSGEHEPLPFEETIRAAAVLADGSLVLHEIGALAIYSLRDGTLQLLASVPLSGSGELRTWGGGKVILSFDGRSVRLFGWAHGCLAPIGDLAADVDPYGFLDAGERAFVAGAGCMLELRDLARVWERFERSAHARRAAPLAGAQVLFDRVQSPPRNDERGPGLPAVAKKLGARNFWQRGAGDLALCIRFGTTSEVLAGDATGVHPLTPPLEGKSMQGCDWRPDGKAVLYSADDVLYEVDLVKRTSRRLTDQYDGYVYTAEGIGLVRGKELVCLRWRHGSSDEPVETTRVTLPGTVVSLYPAAGGRVLVLTVGKKTILLALHDGKLHGLATVDTPKGTLEAAWIHGGAFFLDDGSRTWRLADIEAALRAAVAQRPLVKLAGAKLAAAILLDFDPDVTE